MFALIIESSSEAKIYLLQDCIFLGPVLTGLSAACGDDAISDLLLLHFDLVYVLGQCKERKK
jgi:hypothetical protein